MGASQSELADFPDPGPAVTPERILTALRNHEARQDVEITELKDSAGNVKGEGFMSSLACVREKLTLKPCRKKFSVSLCKSVPLLLFQMLQSHLHTQQCNTARNKTSLTVGLVWRRGLAGRRAVIAGWSSQYQESRPEAASV